MLVKGLPVVCNDVDNLFENRLKISQNFVHRWKLFIRQISLQETSITKSHQQTRFFDISSDYGFRILTIGDELSITLEIQGLYVHIKIIDSITKMLIFWSYILSLPEKPQGKQNISILLLSRALVHHMLCFRFSFDLNPFFQNLYKQRNLLPGLQTGWKINAQFDPTNSIENTLILKLAFKEIFKISSSKYNMNELSRRTPCMVWSEIAHLWPKSRGRHAWVTACGRWVMWHHSYI